MSSPAPRRPVFPMVLIATHLAVAVLGYAGWRAISPNSSDHPGGTNEPKPWKAARDRGDGRPQRMEDEDEIRAERLRRGDALLARITEVNEVMPGTAPAPHEPLPLEEVVRLADELPPADDILATVMKLETQITPPNGTLKDARELEARYLQWLRTDTAAAVMHLSKAMEKQASGSLFDFPDPPEAALEASMREKGWAPMIGHIVPGDHPWMEPFIVREFARQGDPTRLPELAALPRWNEEQAFNQMSRSWPLEKADGFLKMAGWKSGVQLSDFAAAHGDAGMKWLMERMKSPEMGERTRFEVEAGYSYYRHVKSNPQLDPALRVATTIEGKLDTNAASPEEQGQLLVDDVPRSLEKGRDWRYAFRHGAVTADQVLEEMRRRMPQMAESQPEKLRDILFNELAEDNALAAMALLADLPEEERWKKALGSQSSQGLGGDDPDKFAAFIRQMPPELAEELWEERLHAWNRAANDGPRIGAPYVDWLRELPEADREMAVYQLMRRRPASPSQSGVIRQLVAKMAEAIADPRLREKMEDGK